MNMTKIFNKYFSKRTVETTVLLPIKNILYITIKIVKSRAEKKKILKKNFFLYLLIN
jgi:hypothetical protein